MNKVISKVLKSWLPVIIICFAPLLVHTYPPEIIEKIDKRLYFATFILIVLCLLFYKFFHNSEQISENKIYKFVNIFPDWMLLLTIFLFLLITQNYFLNYETLTWDVPSYLVATYDVENGNLPYTTQWETKGPLLVYIYSFISLIAGKSYVFFRIINDIVLFLIVFVLFKISMILSKKNKAISYFSALLFSSIFGMRWYVSEFSEVYCILFLSISYWIHLTNEKNNYKKLIFTGALISLSSLINQVSILFLIPIFFDIFINKTKKYKQISIVLFSSAIPQILFFLLYFLSGHLNIYLINYFILPFTYVENTGVDKNLIYEFTVWLRELFWYQKYLYFSIILILFFNFVELFNNSFLNNIKKYSLIYLSTILSFSIYFLGGWGFAHHLIYFILFFCLLIPLIKNSRRQTIAFVSISICTILILNSTFTQSFSNLKNVEEIQNNYPLFKLSKELDKEFNDFQDYDVLALEYVLILYYLEKPNYAYIIHPTNHFQDYITNVLIEYELIEVNNVMKLLNKKPDVILCNPERIHMGKVLKNENFDCEIEKYNNFYKQLDTKEFREDRNIEYYFDKYKKLNVFVKKEH